MNVSDSRACATYAYGHQKGSSNANVSVWALQNVAIAEAKAAYLAAGWGEVILLDVGEYFPSYEYVDTSKENGGKVYVHIANDGGVTFYEGQLSRKEIKARQRAEAGETATTNVRPEITKAMGNYLNLHRHAAVRSDLLSHPNMALRLMAAHMIAGSDLWDVKADPQKAAKPEIADSLATNTAQQAFEVERQAVADLLGLDGALLRKPDSYNARPDIAEVLMKLLELDDAEILRVLTCLMADSLAVSTGVVETLAQTFGTNMQAAWTIDETFYDLSCVWISCLKTSRRKSRARSKDRPRGKDTSMPINPDDYRAFFKGHNLTSDTEDAIIHSVAYVLEGLIDREQRAIETMIKRVSPPELDSKEAENPLRSKRTKTNKTGLDSDARAANEQETP